MAERSSKPELRGNRLLDSLTAGEWAQLAGRLSPVTLPIKTVLFEPGQQIDAVHFPLDGVISLVTALEDGAIVEVATVGNEGIVGVPLLQGGTLAVRAISQVSGRALRMEAGSFLCEVDRIGTLGDLVRRYVQALFGQISQAAACNRLHSNEERLSRWLLMSHDRVGVDEFAITHEFLGQMLGSRRATVTLSELGYRNVHVRAGDGYRGWAEAAPFDRIIVTAAPDHIPQPLIRQLAPGGRMVIPVGDAAGARACGCRPA